MTRLPERKELVMDVRRDRRIANGPLGPSPVVSDT